MTINETFQKSIELSKQGMPVAWEKGGAYTNTGGATVITGPDGERLTPIYIVRNGHRACLNHALFMIGRGQHVINVLGKNGENVTIDRIEFINKEEKTATFLRIAFLAMGEWSGEEYIKQIPELSDAILASINKAGTYHCQIPVWFNEPKDHPIKKIGFDQFFKVSKFDINQFLNKYPDVKTSIKEKYTLYAWSARQNIMVYEDIEDEYYIRLYTHSSPYYTERRVVVADKPLEGSVYAAISIDEINSRISKFVFNEDE